MLVYFWETVYGNVEDASHTVTATFETLTKDKSMSIALEVLVSVGTLHKTANVVAKNGDSVLRHVGSLIAWTCCIDSDDRAVVSLLDRRRNVRRFWRNLGLLRTFQVIARSFPEPKTVQP